MLRALEKVDNFHQLGAGFVYARHIVKGHTCRLRHIDFRLTLTDSHEPTGRAHAPHENPPDGHEDQRRDDPGQEGIQPVTLELSLKLNAGRFEIRDEGGIIQLHRHEAMLTMPRFAEFLSLRLR